MLLEYRLKENPIPYSEVFFEVQFHFIGFEYLNLKVGRVTVWEAPWTAFSHQPASLKGCG
jgi:hypothetical protein